MLKCSLITGIVLLTAFTSYAGVVVVPYDGSFDESTIQIGDYHPTEGGDYNVIGKQNIDVPLFKLVDGNNVFKGSVITPSDPADGFLLEVGSGYSLIGATISFGTNLSSLSDFLYAEPGPDWILSEISGEDPLIFRIDDLGQTYMGEARDYVAPSFIKEKGVYSVLLGNGTFATYNNSAPIDYKMTFSVTGPQPTPLPSALFLIGTGLLGLVGVRRKRQG